MKINFLFNYNNNYKIIFPREVNGSRLINKLYLFEKDITMYVMHLFISNKSLKINLKRRRQQKLSKSDRLF